MSQLKNNFTKIEVLKGSESNKIKIELSWFFEADRGVMADLMFHTTT